MVVKLRFCWLTGLKQCDLLSRIYNRGQKVLGKPRAAMIVSLLPKGDGRLAQG